MSSIVEIARVQRGAHLQRGVFRGSTSARYVSNCGADRQRASGDGVERRTDRGIRPPQLIQVTTGARGLSSIHRRNMIEHYPFTT